MSFESAKNFAEVSRPGRGGGGARARDAKAFSHDFYYLLPKAAARAIVHGYVAAESSPTAAAAPAPLDGVTAQVGGPADADEDLDVIVVSSFASRMVDATLQLSPWPAVAINGGTPIPCAVDFFAEARRTWEVVTAADAAARTERQYREALHPMLLAVQPVLAEVWDACIAELLAGLGSALGQAGEVHQDSAHRQATVEETAAAPLLLSLTSAPPSSPSLVSFRSPLECRIEWRACGAEMVASFARVYPFAASGLAVTVSVCWSEAVQGGYAQAVVASMAGTAAWLMGIPTAAQASRDSVCILVRLEWGETE